MVFNPQPRPAPRPPKQRKLLPRISARRAARIAATGGASKTIFAKTRHPKRMTHDVASFNKTSLEQIYGPQPNCFILPSRKASEFHHIFGRGGTREDRFIFSSVLNACPISREPHDTCPLLNARGFRQALFDHAFKHVSYAIGRGNYTMSETDQLFLAWVRGEGYDSPDLPL